MNFWTNIDTPLDFFVVFLAIFVVFINGWTDAPNSIYSVVASKRLKLWQGALLGGIFNFLGVFLGAFVTFSVSKSIFSLASPSGGYEAGIICLSSFLTVIVFGTVSWLFGMPSSESHALIFSLFGASLSVLGVSTGALISAIKIIFYMVFSCVLAYFLTRFITLLLRKRRLPYGRLLTISCALSSLMHGAQDGQKFIAVLSFLLIGKGTSHAPIFLVLLVSVVMLTSTLLGGGKIIKSLSEISPDAKPSSTFFCDIGSFLAMLICSILGMPISTGNVKAVSIFASAKAEGEATNKRMISKIIVTSLITLPASFILGVIFSRLALLVF